MSQLPLCPHCLEPVRSGYHGSCPNCGTTIEKDFIVCPVCNTQVRNVCPTCKRPLEAHWKVCPFCRTHIQ